MDDSSRDDLRYGIEEVVRAATLCGDVLHGYDRRDAVFLSVPRTPAVRHEWRVSVNRLDSDATTPALPPLDAGQLLGLALTEVTAQLALASFILILLSLPDLRPPPGE